MTQEMNRMKIDNIDIQATIEKAQAVVREDKQLSAATKSMFEILILIITLLVNRLGLNSTNSSKPPSTDPNRKRQTREKTGKKPGGQMGHVGTTLQKVDNPFRIRSGCRSAKDRLSTSIKKPTNFWVTLRIEPKANWLKPIWLMPTRRVSTSVEKGIGCMGYPTICGHFIILMKKGARRP